MANSPPKVQQWLAWGLPFPLIVLNAWVALQVFDYLEPLVTVFGLAVLLAFLLNYPTQVLQKRGLGHGQAASLVFAVAVLLVITCGVTLVPILLEQFREIARLLPQWIDSSSAKLQALNAWVVTRNLPIDVSHLAGQVTDRLPEEVQSLAEELVTLALETVNSISDAVLTAVLTFYFLVDGERLWKGLFKRVPERFGTPIQRSLQLSFQNYFLGQVTLALLVGFAMTVAFLVLKLPFGLLFGISIGLLTLIPFGDVLGFTLVSLFVTFHDPWLGAKTFGVAIVIDQIIDQAIAPRLLGSFTGLSPILVLAALVVGTKVGGLLGLLIAVPIAGFVKSLLETWGATQESTLATSEQNGLSLTASEPEPVVKP